MINSQFPTTPFPGFSRLSIHPLELRKHFAAKPAREDCRIHVVRPQKVAKSGQLGTDVGGALGFGAISHPLCSTVSLLYPLCGGFWPAVEVQRSWPMPRVEIRIPRWEAPPGAGKAGRRAGKTDRLQVIRVPAAQRVQGATMQVREAAAVTQLYLAQTFKRRTPVNWRLPKHARLAARILAFRPCSTH